MGVLTGSNEVDASLPKQVAEWTQVFLQLFSSFVLHVVSLQGFVLHVVFFPLSFLGFSRRDRNGNKNRSTPVHV